MDNKSEKKFLYYARIIIMIIVSIELILNLVFLLIIINIRDNFKRLCNNYEYISEHFITIVILFSFFLFFSSFFLFEFLCHCCCNYSNDNCYHCMMLIIFLICQILYLIYCILFPVYLSGLSLSGEDDCIEEEKKIIKKYKTMTLICYIFLIIIIFLDFILLNIYKTICCQMNKICRYTEYFFINLGKYFLNKLCCKSEGKPKIDKEVQTEIIINNESRIIKYTENI